MRKNLLRFYFLLGALIVLMPGTSVFAQTVNDYRTVSSGAWTTTSIWENWNGTAWVTPAVWPNAPAANIQISAGHIVTVPTPGPYNIANLTVDPTAKLYSSQTASNVYLSVWGTNIVCNGQIGDGLNSDGLAFNFEAVNTTISGVGQFVSCRFRKSSATNIITDLIVAMDVTLRWSQVSFTQLYNNTTTSSRFNVTVNFPYTLNCEGSPGQPGNLTIDGVSGTGTADAGGTITVNGTLIVPGVLFAASNNPTNIAYTTGSGLAAGTTITVSQTVGLAVGQRVIGAGIGANATIVSIVGTTVTLSVANTGAVSGALSILPSTAPTISGSVGQSTVTVSSSAGLYVGQSISGTGIASGAMITAISGNTLTLSIANNAPVSGYATVGNSCNFIVNSGGLLKAGAVYSPAGTAAGFMNFTVKNGGKLELTGAQGFPAGTLNWSTTNNRYNFETGSTVEYSFAGNQSVLQQSDFVSTVTSQNQYHHLIISGSGTKTIRTGILTVRGDLTITGGSAILDQEVNDPDIVIGGNWSNYAQLGFTESTNALKSVKFYNTQAIQTITCPGGEQYFNLWIAKTGAANVVQLQDNVTVTSTLTLGQLGTTNSGVLRLNGKSLNITSASTTAIKLQGNAGTLRYIISEFTNNTSRVNWNIGASTGTYIIPFGQNSLMDTLPFYYIKSSTTNIGQLSVATYGTPAFNQPWPTTPVAVTNLLSLYSYNNTPDNRAWTVDRYWYLGVTNTAPATVVFTYDDTELPDSVADPLEMRAQYWSAAGATWELPQQGQTDSSGVIPAPGNIRYSLYSVKVDTLINYNTSWTLSSLQSPLYATPLPIELLRFDARPAGDRVTVSWITATEINNDFFTVERSRDGQSFEVLGTLKGAGNTTEEQYYQLLDEAPFSGISYYRLRQTDFDGKFTYSEIVAVDLSRKANSPFALYPNPSTDWTTLTVTDEVREELNVTIMDMNGRTVFSGEFNPQQTPSFPIDLNHFSKGVYSIVITGISVNERFRLVKD